MRGKLIRLSIWAIAILTIPAAAIAYTYPYTDPYYATLTAAILKADHLDKTLKYEDFSLRLYPERSSVPFFGQARNKITLRLWKQKKAAPMILLISGLGGDSNANYHNYLASQFYHEGFHVLVFPSPFHWSFALAASDSTLPGITRQDAADLYKTMVEGIEKVEERSGISITGFGLLGVSMGALQAAYVSAIDAAEGHIGFSATLMINPPVDPLFSGSVIDSLFHEGENFSRDRRRSLQERIYFFGIDALTRQDIKLPAYFQNLETRLPTTLEERKFLIGRSLKDFLPAMIFASQQVNDLGVLKNPIATKNAEARLAECEQISYMEYLKYFLLPGLSKREGRQISFEELSPDVLLNGVENHLRQNERITLMHNTDDFIVNEAQLAYLKNVFGSRMHLFPHGGHMGNLWHPENLQAIMNTFTHMKALEN